MPMGERRILLVDDNRELLHVYKRIVDSQVPDFVADTAASGFEALERIAEHLPSAVMTDLNMPGMGGRELYKEVRKLCQNCGRDLPRFIFISAVRTALSGVEDLCRECGAATLLKPFSVDELRAALNSLAPEA